jgi:hypothetical protein
MVGAPAVFPIYASEVLMPPQPPKKGTGPAKVSTPIARGGGERREVKISLVLNGPRGFTVTVEPWDVHVWSGDWVEWQVVGSDSPIKWFRIEASGGIRDGVWPFEDQPPHESYTGHKSKGAKVTTGKRKLSAQLHDAYVKTLIRNHLSGLETALRDDQEGMDFLRHLIAATRLPYTIAIGFMDGEGVERRADIDPDMIVET